MKTCKTVISIILAILLSSPAFGAGEKGSGDLEHLLTEIQRHYDRTASYSAKFEEEIAAVGAPKRERSGKVYFRKPGRMRWDFAGEQPETIVSDGTTLYNFDPGLNQVIETPLSQALKSSGATAFLLGMGNLRRDFKASFAPNSGAGQSIGLALVPKAGGYTIQIGVDPATYDLITLVLTDQLGNVTRVKFTDIHNNTELADILFIFKVPAGVDIVTPPPSP